MGSRVVQTICVLWILGLAAGRAGAQTDRGHLREFQTDVRVFDPHRAGVAATIRLDGAARTPAVRITLVRYPGQEIREIQVADQDGAPYSFPLKAERGALVLEVHPPWPPAQPDAELVLQLDYTVVSPSRSIVRVPLPVPDARTAFGTHPVLVRVEIPEGQLPVGDTFPTLTWQDSTHGFARLADVPSLVMIRSKPAAFITLADKLLTTGTLSDVALVVLILTASFLWRRKRRQKIEQPGPRS